ncbi:MAG: hypothetical protein LBR81_00370 [Prevotellaceae bacterium]|jgi:hypothetical protein|nr:hypothetical protein [Prevotellaceae bacterium]
MNKNNKLERIKEIIRYLIFTQKIGYESIQKDLTNVLKSEKSVISRALNGDEKYLTDNFLVKLNSAFGEEFNLEWLLTGKGDMLKKETAGFSDNPQIEQALAENIYKKLTEANEKLDTVKDDIIELQKLVVEHK